MKNKTLLLTIIGVMTLTMLTNCRDRFQKDTKNTKEAIIINEIETTTKATWDKFKKESEAVIDNTEIEIEKLGKKISEANKDEYGILLKNLDKLKQKNEELKDKLIERSYKFKNNLIEFNESSKELEQKFETEFKQDTRELKTAIKDFFQ